MFGHRKGAFTGAINDKVGRFEMCNKGSIFLDEIGEISPVLQLKLLSVIQDREFERVGDSRPVKVDTRIIAATNKDLWQMVQEQAAWATLIQTCAPGSKVLLVGSHADEVECVVVKG